MSKPPVKPRLTSDVVAELELYSVEGLRHARAETSETLIRLRNACVPRDEIESWIRWKEAVEQWKEQRDTKRFRLTLFFAVVAALASILAAVEGWQSIVSWYHT
jgi:hypothetical protein